jgi:hypothetical protein
MDSFDFYGEQVVTTAQGAITLSTAGHEDGSVSVIAWLAATGQRVGYGRGFAHRRVQDEIEVDRVLAGTTVGAVMQALLDAALGRTPRGEPLGQRLVRAGIMSQADLSDLLGWQWLLAELGQPRRLGELVAAAGFLSDPASRAVAGEPITRREPRPPVADPPGVLGDSAVELALA